MPLRAMTPEQADAALEPCVREYARELRAAGEYPTGDEALAEAWEEIGGWLADDRVGSERFLCHIEAGEAGDAGEVVGQLWFEVAAALGGSQLQYLHVAPDRRGQGHARRALTAYHAWARRAGAHASRLFVFRHNAGAVRLYERAGYVVEQAVTMGQAEAPTRLRMARPLPPPPPPGVRSPG